MNVQEGLVEGKEKQRLLPIRAQELCPVLLPQHPYGASIEPDGSAPCLHVLPEDSFHIPQDHEWSYEGACQLLCIGD